MVRKRTLHINEEYFDPGNESKSMYYVLGALFRSVNIKNGWFKFTSTHERLVEIVKDCLECEYKLGKQKDNNSYFIRVPEVPDLISRLEQRGIHPDKRMREFPKKIPDKYLDHFIRGFMDACAYITLDQDDQVSMLLSFRSRKFLAGLRETLTEITGTRKNSLKNSILQYFHRDCMKIHDLIYADWEYIQEKGLYLPEKKKMFNIDNSDYLKGPINVLSIRRVQRAKELIAENKPVIEIAVRTGHITDTPVESYQSTFKHVTGMLPEEWKQTSEYKKMRIKYLVGQR